MKVIFLDVDGVINSGNNQQHVHKVRRNCNNMYFDTVCMENLQRLVKSTGAELVLSSTWRLPDERTYSMQHMANLKRRLAAYGLSLSGETPSGHFYRHDEINAWLEAHPEVTGYVILDDVNDGFVEENYRRLVLTDEIVGLTAEDVEKAIKILEG